MSNDTAPWKRDWSEHGEINRGGQGVITEVRSIADPTKRAVLKRIVPRWQNDPQARERLQHEADLLTKLNELGARVPRVIDSSSKHDSVEPFVLMEFISGVRFDEWLKSKAPVKTNQAVTITRAIAETIGLCHTHKIGHRDIKPSNIILKDGDISSPYILDFGISFDSRQTIILTHEGEMFWNEFIILPECQDLEGGHRDLRSDITALVGVFFSCLTGRPPIVLRNATDQAPHQRHEKLVAATASDVQEAERLMWFFQRGFAFRISERFQSMSEFISELMRFADSSNEGMLDPIEQFKILNHNIEATDRKVQLVALRRKYEELFQPIWQTLHAKLIPISQNEGSLGSGQVQIPPKAVSQLPQGEIFDAKNARSYTISRNHFDGSAMALLTGFAVGMDIHLYVCSYTWPLPPEKNIEWVKVAVVEDSQPRITERTVAVIVETLANRLAHEIRNLILKREAKK